MTAFQRWFDGNQVIPLDATTGAGILVDGSAVIFAVDRATGERRHLFSINPGEPVRPIVNPPDAAWTIVGVALEECCIESREDAPDWEEVVVLIRWLEKMAEALSRFIEPGEPTAVSPGEHRLQPGSRLAIDEGMNFVRLETGNGRFAGTPLTPGAVVALVPGLWLGAESEAEWHVLHEPPTDTLAGTAALLTDTLDLVIPALTQALAEYAVRRNEDDRRRFTMRREQATRLMAGAVGMLAGREAAAGDPDRDAIGGAKRDALEGALGAVAGVLGVALRPLPAGGRSGDRVQQLAQASGLRVRTVVLAARWWQEDSGPLLAYRTDGTPIALLPATPSLFGRARYDILDPSDGSRRPASEMSVAGLNPFARMLYPPLPGDLSTWGLLRHLMRPRMRDLRTIGVAGFGAAALAAIVPMGAALLIGQAVPDADRRMVWQIAAGLVAATVGSALFLLAQAIATLRLQTSAYQVLQSGVWDYLLTLGPPFFRGFSAGQLRARADAVTRIHQMLSADALRSLLAGVASLLTFAPMLYYSPGLALIALACGACVIVAIWLGARALYRTQSRWQELDELLAGLALQAITAVSKLQIAGATHRAFAQWARQYSRKQTLALELRAIRDRIRIVNLVVPAAGTAVGFVWLLAHPVPLGPFLASLALFNAFLSAVTASADTIGSLVLTANLWQRMRTILSASPEVHPSRTDPGRLRGSVTVENLTFRYRGDGPLILDAVSIRAEPGECIALTGPSGSGKSTLVNLLLRFEHPQAGAIYFDGRDLASLDIQAVRRQIGVITQDGRVMAGSIFENICPGGRHTLEEAWEAARAAGLAEDISRLPMGMRTRVSDGGGNFSGGQRQRLLIARALVLKPRILIFDEATSALDNRTQASVSESLMRLKATRILVAHRLSTLRSADRIYVIEKGRVVQEGSYTTLVSQPGLFARLVSRQTA